MEKLGNIITIDYVNTLVNTVSKGNRTVKKILIVDDQIGIRLLLDEVFRSEQYETILASNGIEALKCIKEEEKIDCVLLDLRIPGMDGLEIVRRIKEENDNMPIFMMTAFAEQEMIDTANDLGIEKYFIKPFNIVDVIQGVNSVVM